MHVPNDVFFKRFSWERAAGCLRRAQQQGTKEEEDKTSTKTKGYIVTFRTVGACKTRKRCVFRSLVRPEIATVKARRLRTRTLLAFWIFGCVYIHSVLNNGRWYVLLFPVVLKSRPARLFLSLPSIIPFKPRAQGTVLLCHRFEGRL